MGVNLYDLESLKSFFDPTPYRDGPSTEDSPFGNTEPPPRPSMDSPATPDSPFGPPGRDIEMPAEDMRPIRMGFPTNPDVAPTNTGPLDADRMLASAGQPPPPPAPPGPVLGPPAPLRGVRDQSWSEDPPLIARPRTGAPVTSGLPPTPVSPFDKVNTAGSIADSADRSTVDVAERQGRQDVAQAQQAADTMTRQLQVNMAAQEAAQRRITDVQRAQDQARGQLQKNTDLLERRAQAGIQQRPGAQYRAAGNAMLALSAGLGNVSAANVFNANVNQDAQDDRMDVERFNATTSALNSANSARRADFQGLGNAAMDEQHLADAQRLAHFQMNLKELETKAAQWAPGTAKDAAAVLVNNLKKQLATDMDSSAANQIKAQTEYMALHPTVTHGIPKPPMPPKDKDYPGDRAGYERALENYEQFEVPRYQGQLRQAGSVSGGGRPGESPMAQWERQPGKPAERTAGGSASIFRQYDTGTAGQRMDAVNGKTSPVTTPTGTPGPRSTVDDSQFRTKLTPDDEKQFQTWATSRGIKDLDHPDSHYDYRGFWRGIQDGDVDATQSATNGHFPDKWKTPGHPTFSDESVYATEGDNHWENTPNGARLVDQNGNVVADEGRRPRTKADAANRALDSQYGIPIGDGNVIRLKAGSMPAQTEGKTEVLRTQVANTVTLNRDIQLLAALELSDDTSIKDAVARHPWFAKLAKGLSINIEDTSKQAADTARAMLKGEIQAAYKERSKTAGENFSAGFQTEPLFSTSDTKDTVKATLGTVLQFVNGKTIDELIANGYDVRPLQKRLKSATETIDGLGAPVVGPKEIAAAQGAKDTATREDRDWWNSRKDKLMDPTYLRNVFDEPETGNGKAGKNAAPVSEAPPEYNAQYFEIANSAQRIHDRVNQILAESQRPDADASKLHTLYNDIYAERQKQVDSLGELYHTGHRSDGLDDRAEQYRLKHLRFEDNSEAITSILRSRGANIGQWVDLYRLGKH